LYSGYELWRLRPFSFGGYGLALAALALVVFGAYDSYPNFTLHNENGGLKEHDSAINSFMGHFRDT